MITKKKTNGAALITVLIIVFIVMAIVTDIAVRNYRVIRRLTNQKVMDQAYSILFSTVDFARAGLATSGMTSKIDALTDIWAQPIARTEVFDNIQMSGYLIDEQGKFNINDLVSRGNVNPLVEAQLSTLFNYLNIPSGLAYNIASYMAAPQNEADIMNQYTLATPPSRPAGRPLVDLSELLLVKGMQPSWVYKLQKYVTAIPQSVDFSNESSESGTYNSNPNMPNANAHNIGSIPVNINTALPEVIAAKSGIPLPVAQRITTVRSTTPFKSTQDITNFLSSNGIMLSQGSTGGNSTNNINIATLTTQSSYFSVHSLVDDGDYEFGWVALLYRPSRNGQWPQVLWQHPE